jgi:lysozyme family protein
MADTFTQCLSFTLLYEGGWADDPRDNGGCTMRGITLPSYQSWKHNSRLTCGDLRLISSQDVSNFYHEMMWLPSHSQVMPVGVDLMVFDAGVNMGVSRSIKLLQQGLHLTTDGQVGPATIGAVLTAESTDLIAILANVQEVFYRAIPSFVDFGHGWLNRLAARKTKALAMMQMS